jgi:DNA polymerase-3 subunit alpha
MPLRYTELRHHTEYSMMIGTGRMDDHVARAAELGYPTICLTEVDTLRATYAIHEEATDFTKHHAETPIRAVFGIEISVCLDHRAQGLPQEGRDALAETGLKAHHLRRAIYTREGELGLTKTWRLCIRALTYEGLKNMYMLSSIAWTDGHFIRPRIDIALLIKHSEGIAISLGGYDGWATEALYMGDYATAIAQLEELQATFEGRMWLEIQPHGFQHVKLNRAIQLVARRLDIPVIAVNDVLYIRESDTDAHEVILCLRANKNLNDPEHPVSPKGRHIRSGDEMMAAFREEHPDLDEEWVAEAIERTVEVAALHKAKFEIDRFKALIPKPDLPTGDDGEEVDDFTFLRTLCTEGWDWRDIEGRAVTQAAAQGMDLEAMRAVYIKRLTKELGAIRRQKFTPYFLIVRDLIYWARRQGIMVGPGRGSAAGSLVCYLLGVTAIDPIEHQLMFERFISPSRIDMPDIDMDYEDTRRQEVIDYLHEKYGEGHVAHIVTIGRMRGKAALKDVCRVLDIPLHEVNAVTASIIERSSGDERVSQTVADSFVEFEVCRKFNAKYPQVLPLVVKLEGCMRQTGVHAAGIIPSPVPLMEVIPLERHERNGKLVLTTGMEMYGSEASGLLKLDVLGLRTLAVLADALRAIKARTGRDLDLEALPLNDKRTLDMFTGHQYVGIFQYDSTGAHAACEGIEFTTFEDVAALTALNRPGTMRSGLATEYKKRKQDPSRIKPLHPLVDAICADTLGVLVYQEQVLRIFVEVGGYEPGTADSLRKKIAKKWGDETLGREREMFVAGAVANGVDAVDAGKLMDNITFFGSYGFNKSHASAYGVIAYWGMWLKCYYPTEFIYGLMKNEPDRAEIMRFVKEAGRLGASVLPPDVNYSGVNFTIDKDGAIRSSLADIKGVGEGALGALVAAQPFSDIVDFLKRVPARSANSRVLEALLKAGALRSLLPNLKWALEGLKDKKGWLEMARKGKAKGEGTAMFRAGWEVSLLEAVEASRAEPDYNEEDTLYLAAEVSPLGGGKHPTEVYKTLIAEHMATVDWLPLDDDDHFWSQKAAYIKGVLIEIKYNQVGDFHTGAEPSEHEKLKMGWHKRYANVNIEDETGVQRRVKIDWDIFEDYRHIVDKGEGVCVAMRISIAARFHNCRCIYMVDLEDMRQKSKGGHPFGGWELCFTDHPVGAYTHKPLAVKMANKKFVAIVMITHVKRTIDKNGNIMAFFGIEDANGFYSDGVCFASTYDNHGASLQAGAIVTASFKRDGSSVFLADDGVMKTHSVITAARPEA